MHAFQPLPTAGQRHCFATSVSSTAVRTCRSSIQRISFCYEAITNVHPSTEFMGSMMSASDGTTFACGRPSQTASTACQFQRWWMKRYAARQVLLEVHCARAMRLLHMCYLFLELEPCYVCTASKLMANALLVCACVLRFVYRCADPLHAWWLVA